MVSDRIVTLRTISHRMCTLYDMAFLSKVFPLPFDEPAVLGVHRRKPPSPVYWDATRAHDPLVFVRKMPDDRQRIGKCCKHIRGNFIEIAVQGYGFLISSCNTLGNSNHRSPGHMESHGVKDGPPPHPPETGDHIRCDVGSSMPHVHRTTRVGVCHIQIKFLCIAGIRFKSVFP